MNFGAPERKRLWALREGGKERRGFAHLIEVAMATVRKATFE
jgi:hypothetical protein